MFPRGRTQRGPKFFLSSTIICAAVRFYGMISTVYSIKAVERQYATGEEPVYKIIDYEI